jgi:hypothetical protein
MLLHLSALDIYENEKWFGEWLWRKLLGALFP